MFPERPIVGVGAVIVNDGCVVLVRRAHEPLKGEWSLPGGAVECGETLEVAIAREVREETGLDVEVGPMVDVLDRIRFDPNGRVLYHYVLVDFVCKTSGGTLCCGTDAADAAWAPIMELTQYGLAETTLSVVQKALDRLREGPWVPREVRWNTE